MSWNTSITLTQKSKEQLDTLMADGWGSASGVFRTALDRMYREEYRGGDEKHSADGITGKEAEVQG